MTPSQARGGPAFWFSYLGALALGAWLRLTHIGEQILIGDEWHALHYVRDHGALEIATHFGISDHCIPLTLYYELLAGTIGLDELWMRAPSLAAGLLALILLPLFVRRAVGAEAGAVFAWLLAISAVQIFYSRFARPYAVACPLALVALFAFRAWWAGGRARLAGVFVGCAALCVWFLPVFAPLVLAPLLFALLESAWRRRAPRRGYWALAAALVACLALLLGPPLWVDFASLSAKAGLESTAHPASRVISLVAGTRTGAMSFLFVVALLAGLRSLLKRNRGLFAYFAFAALAQVAALALLSPSQLGVDAVLVRYNLPTQVLALAVAAIGFVELDQLLRSDWPLLPRFTVSAPALVGLVGLGPLLAFDNPSERSYRWPNAWTNHAVYQVRYADRGRREWVGRNLQLDGISSFYSHRLRRSPRDTRIVEAPWSYVSGNQPFPLYQRIHRRGVLIGFAQPPASVTSPGNLPWPDERFRFRNFVHLDDLEGMRERGARFLVLHKDLFAELAGEHHSGPPEDAAPWIERYRRELGEPEFEDDELCVFRLAPKRKP